MKKKIYISGPMSNLPENNFPAFFEAERQLREILSEEWDIVNPARLDQESGVAGEKPYEWYLRRDYRVVCDCTDMIMIEEWHSSNGATAENVIAKSLSMPIWMLRDGKMIEYAETALETAQRLVYGDRCDTYGHPYGDYSKTAAFWSIILGTEVTAEQAILCMVSVKISRELNNPKRDNRLDGAGYFECLDRCYKLSDDEKNEMLESIGIGGSR